MRLLALTLVIVGTLYAAAGFKEDAADKEREKLQGTWKLTGVEINGDSVIEEAIKEGRITVKDDKYTFVLGDTTLEVKYKTDPTKNPKRIDITFLNGPHQNKTAHGIYEIDKDTFKICRALEPEKEPPAEFATKPDSGLMLVVYKRDKEAGEVKVEKAEGKVTLNGAPLEGALIKLVPVEATGWTARGLTDEDGNFQMTTFLKGDGAPAGEYKVLITVSEKTESDKTDLEVAAVRRLINPPVKQAGASSLPAIYGDANKTPLRVLLPSAGKLALELRSE